MSETNEKAKPVFASSAGSALAFEAAVAEHLNWLTESEIAEDEVGNTQARDALARASSYLGCLLIKHGVYVPNTQFSDAQHSEQR